MGPRLSARVTLSARATIKCALCGALDGEHTGDCPRGWLDTLLARQQRIPCPECHANEVDINAHDVYECRKCHTQFSCGAQFQQEGSRIVYLDDPTKGDLTAVVVLPDKGDNQFPFDQAIEKAGVALRLAKRKRKGRG